LTQEALNWPLAHTTCGVPGEPLAKPDLVSFCFLKIPLTTLQKLNTSPSPFFYKWSRGFVRLCVVHLRVGQSLKVIFAFGVVVFRVTGGADFLCQ
jgi:hypothetical protein